MKYKASMKKEKPTVEEFAAEMADKEDNPTIEKYREADRHQESKQIPLTEAQRNLVEHIEAGSCIMGEMRKDREDFNWQEKYDKEHKLRQEAEGELTILKGIETNRVKEAQEALANALEVNESHQRLYGKLQVRIAELEDENKKMHDTLEKQLEGARKAGL